MESIQYIEYRTKIAHHLALINILNTIHINSEGSINLFFFNLENIFSKIANYSSWNYQDKDEKQLEQQLE